MAKQALAVCNPTVQGEYVAGYQRFTNTFNGKIYDEHICSDNWQDNRPGSEEALTLIQMMK